MKKLNSLLVLLICLLFCFSCAEEDDTIYEHYLIIWSDFSGPPISVYVDDQYVGKITSYFPNETPDCGDSGSVTIRVYPSAGSYRVYAEEEGTNRIWDTYATVHETIECRNLKLTE